MAYGYHEDMTRRTRLIASGLALALVVATSQPAYAWRPKKGRATDYISTRSGSVSFAVIGPRGGTFRYRATTRVPAASVMKVMFLVAYLRSPSVRDRKLRDSDRDLLAPMIKVSDNDSATRIADMLGSDDMYRLARAADMNRFSYTRPWGTVHGYRDGSDEIHVQARALHPEETRALRALPAFAC